jgi:chaperonin GroEL
MGVEMSHFNNSFLGTCKSVTINDSETIIVTDDSHIDSVEERVAVIKKQLENEKQDYMKDQLRDRLANLTGEAATIKVGATSEVELGELRDRIEDALNAAKSALAEGIVSGGGVALLRAAAIADVNQPLDLSKDAMIGWNAVIEACKAPIKQLCENADQSADLIIDNIQQNEYATVYNFSTLEYTTPESIGLYDPLKVTRSALESAASIAGTILTTDRVVTTVIDKE